MSTKLHNKSVFPPEMGYTHTNSKPIRAVDENDYLSANRSVDSKSRKKIKNSGLSYLAIALPTVRPMTQWVINFILTIQLLNWCCNTVCN